MGNFLECPCVGVRPGKISERARVEEEEEEECLALVLVTTRQEKKSHQEKNPDVNSGNHKLSGEEWRRRIADYECRQMQKTVERVKALKKLILRNHPDKVAVYGPPQRGRQDFAELLREYRCLQGQIQTRRQQLASAENVTSPKRTPTNHGPIVAQDCERFQHLKPRKPRPEEQYWPAHSVTVVYKGATKEIWWDGKRTDLNPKMVKGKFRKMSKTKVELVLEKVMTGANHVVVE